jgi:hypothetical protein
MVSTGTLVSWTVPDVSTLVVLPLVSVLVVPEVEASEPVTSALLEPEVSALVEPEVSALVASPLASAEIVSSSSVQP